MQAQQPQKHSVGRALNSQEMAELRRAAWGIVRTDWYNQMAGEVHLASQNIICAFGSYLALVIM